MSNQPWSKEHEPHSSNEIIQLPLMPSPTEELTNVRVLERLLDDVSNALKENINGGEEKAFLLPLLFYKYLSDLSNTSLVSSKPFNLPSEYRWESRLSHQLDETIGLLITRTMSDLVWLNPDLEGILNLKNYETYSDVVLKKLIGVISRYRLIPSNDLDLWGKMYEFLLKRFPEKNQSAKGSFYTPRDVVKLMVELIKPNPKSSFYDPACGSGCLSGLFHCLDLGRPEKKLETKLVGQDQFFIASAVAKMDLFFYNNAEIDHGDALYKPLCEKNGDLRAFDYILANPPWNQAGYDKAFYERDAWERFRYGVPRGRRADWGWIQHILASLEKDKGRATVILDLGALSRGSGSELPDSERDIRKAIIEQDIIEAVISLPGNLFYSTSAPCCLLLFTLDKSSDRKEKVLFIDAQKSSQTRRSSKRVGLKPEEHGAIIEAYLQWKIEDDFSCVASLKDISSYDYDLRPILYVSKEVHIVYRLLETIEQELVEARRVRMSSDLKILQHLGRPDQDTAHLETILHAYVSGLSGGHLDEVVYTLVKIAEKDRKQELILEIELREMTSHTHFALNVETARLGECAEIYGGFTPSPAERKQEGKFVPWVKAGDLEQEFLLEVEGRIPEILTITRDGSHSTHIVRPINTVLLAICGGTSTVGKTAILGFPAATNQAVCCIQPFEDIFDHYYLFCYLNFMRRRWTRSLVGSRQDLSLQIVKNHFIPHPDLEQQRKIATKLRPYNERIRGLKREITFLRQMLKA